MMNLTTSRRPRNATPKLETLEALIVLDGSHGGPPPPPPPPQHEAQVQIVDIDQNGKATTIVEIGKVDKAYYVDVTASATVDQTATVSQN